MNSATVSVFNGPTTGLELHQVPLPEKIDQGEVLVQLHAATICGSDIWTYTGARGAEVPLTLGHEGFGTIVHSQRKDLEPGTRVVWSIVDSCGRCPHCTDYDLPQKCDRLFKYGHSKGTLSGTYASHILLHAGTTVLPVSPNLHDGLTSTLGCAFSTAEACLEKIPTEAHSVLVVGLGMVGIAAAYLAKRSGRNVYVMDNRQDKLDMANKMGFHTERPPKVDAVIEVVGKIEPFEQALEHLRIGGTAVVAGLVHPNSHLTIAAERLVRSCWTWVGIHNYNPRHLHRALVSAHSFQDQIEPDQIFSSPFPLQDLDKAMAEAQSSKWFRVIVQP